MSDIKINTGRKYSATVIPNVFIDRYMPEASGSYVKVYLYLLRCQSDNRSDFSIDSAADFLDETEKSVVRALNYWEKSGLLALDRNGEDITGISVLDLPKSDECTVIPEVEAVPAITTVSSNADSYAPVMKTYTRADINKALVDPDISWLTEIVGVYLEKLLTNSDISLIMFMYYDLHFSKELILHLYELCVSRNKKNNKYIQTIAISWFEQGISTVEEANRNSMAFDAYFSVVNKSWNLGRLPGEKEQNFIKSWEEMGLSTDIVKEACDRTLLSISKPNFTYADKMLRSWHDKGYTTLEQIKAGDSGAIAVSPRAARNGVTKSAQSYNNYASHTYSGMDMMEIQRQLLRKSKESAPKSNGENR